MFELIASDIDGTLTNSAGEIPPFTVEVLRTLLDGGTPVVLVTGLNPWPTRRHVERIGHGVRAISLNGVFLLEEGRLSEGAALDPATLREAAEAMVDQGYVPLVYGVDGVTRYLPSEEGMGRVAGLVEARAYQPYEAVGSLEALFATRPVQLSTVETPERATRLHDLLLGIVGDRAYVLHQPSSHFGHWVEINHPEARKDAALLALAERLGVAAEAIVYFGDSLNDLPVFQAIPHAVAVANALPEVQDLAWRVAPSNDEEGVPHFLVEHFALEL
jgi:hypothetical protein